MAEAIERKTDFDDFSMLIAPPIINQTPLTHFKYGRQPDSLIIASHVSSKGKGLDRSDGDLFSSCVLAASLSYILMFLGLYWAVSGSFIYTVWGTVMSKKTEHIFNSDLLTNEADLEKAKSAYKDIDFVVDFPELRHVFSAVDTGTMAYRDRMDLLSIFAVILVTIALLTASWDLLLISQYNIASQALSYVGSISGVVGACLFAYIYTLSRLHRKWLHGRFAAERLRQFHFQFWRQRVPEIADAIGSPEKQSALQAERLSLLHDLLPDIGVKFEPGSEPRLDRAFFRDLDEDQVSMWMIEESQKDKVELPDTLIEAYLDLRTGHQRDYAYQKLNYYDGRRKGGLLQQFKLLSSITIFAALVIFAIDMSVLLSNIGLLPFDWSETFMQEDAKPFLGPVTLTLAIVGLMGRALSEGYQTEANKDRYTKYLVETEKIHDTLSQAQTAEQAYESMYQMERMSWLELVSFVKSYRYAKFRI